MAWNDASDPSDDWDEILDVGVAYILNEEGGYLLQETEGRMISQPDPDSDWGDTADPSDSWSDA